MTGNNCAKQSNYSYFKDQHTEHKKLIDESGMITNAVHVIGL